MTADKTCFVVSPIGAEGSSERQAADDLFELVVEPTLNAFKFNVIRADRIPGSGEITAEIIDLVQTAELCVIDLSGSNANVFYECGRRHENGRPFVQMIRKGERLPFDLAGIRTIFYDLDSARSARQASDELQRYISEFESQGYSSSSAGASLSTLANALHRVESKVDRLAVSPIPPASEIGQNPKDLKSLMRDPRRALVEAIHVGDFPEASRLLGRVAQLVGATSPAVLGPAAVLTNVGDAKALELAVGGLESDSPDIELETRLMLLGAAVRYYHLTDREADGVERLTPIMDSMIDLPGVSKVDRAQIQNQRQRILYGAGKYREALPVAEEVVRLNEDEPAYWYNLSLIQEETGDVAGATVSVDKFMALTDESESLDSLATHLSQAAEIYAKAGRPDDARSAFSRLLEVSPARAAMIDDEGPLHELLQDAAGSASS